MSKMVIDSDGNKEWRNEYSKLHRLDGPAIEWASGSAEWYADGRPHRLDGPALVCADGYKEWWVNGKCHRLDGPAVEHASGSTEWWAYGGQCFNFKSFQEAGGLTDDEMCVIRLKYGEIR